MRRVVDFKKIGCSRERISTARVKMYSFMLMNSREEEQTAQKKKYTSTSGATHQIFATEYSITAAKAEEFTP